MQGQYSFVPWQRDAFFFSLPGSVEKCLLPDFFLGNCTHHWKMAVHLGWEMEYYLNTSPLLSFWNLLPSCTSDGFLIPRKWLHFGPFFFFFPFAKVWDTFLIQAYGKIPSLMKGDVFIMFLSLINLVTRHSLSPAQYHHANPFTLVRIHS